MIVELESLRGAIGGRLVCVLGLGVSLGELDDRIDEFSGVDVCWVSLNDISVPRRILKKIGKDLDVIIGCCAGLERAFDDEDGYVHRYSLGRGNTISEFIWQLNDIGCGAYLVGFDGYCESEPSYYGFTDDSDKYLVTRTPMRHTHKHDTMVLNETFRGWSGVRIVTVGDSSKYIFPKISWEDFITITRGEKNAKV